MSFQYPKSADDPDVPSHISHQFAGVHRLYGAGNVDALSKGPTTPAPWPRIGRTKGVPVYDEARVTAALSGPRHLTETDPRNLHSNQSSVTRPGVQYYMGSDYQKSGRTYADRGVAGNRNPVIWRRSTGENVILSGHHRAAAALLRGEQFHALHVHEAD